MDADRLRVQARVHSAGGEVKSLEEKRRMQYRRNPGKRGSLYEVPVGNSNKHINKGEPADVESVLKAIESAKPIRRTKKA